MSTGPRPGRKTRDSIAANLEATRLLLRALLHHRMGGVLPLVLVLIVVAYITMTIGFLSPLRLLPRGAQVTPFIYPLF